MYGRFKNFFLSMKNLGIIYWESVVDASVYIELRCGGGGGVPCGWLVEEDKGLRRWHGMKDDDDMIWRKIIFERVVIKSRDNIFLANLKIISCKVFHVRIQIIEYLI